MPVADGVNLDRLIYAEKSRRDLSAPASPDPSIFTVGYWLTRKLEKPEALLGEVITNTTRMFIFGPTGVGKTNLGLALSAAMAIGNGFAGWPASRPCKVLYFDGEMPRDLVLERLGDIVRREHNDEILDRLKTNLVVLCMEDFPAEAPFNTEEGRDFVIKAITNIDPDVIIFDNRMSLTEGVMKDEEAWADTLPLVNAITRKRKAQVWIDHTGHETNRGYGTKTKEWRADAVIMLSEIETPHKVLGFKLEFTKARRRRPENWHQFEPITLTLVDDQWIAERAAPSVMKGTRNAATGKPLTSDAIVALDRLNHAVATQGEPIPTTSGFPTASAFGTPIMGVNIEVWRAAFYDAIETTPASQRRTKFSRMSDQLLAARKAAIHQGWVWPVHNRDPGPGA